MRSTRSPQGSAPSQAKPRLHLARPYRRDLSAPVAAAARQAGIELLPWQVELLRDWTAIGDDGKFVHPRCGASIPRQAGKSVDGIAWSLSLAVFMGYKVLWTDHNYSTTCEMLDRFRAILGRKVADDSAEHPRFNARVTEVNNKTAQEYFKFKGGGVLAFSTRTKAAKMGFSFDVVVYDEAQELRQEHTQVITPTMSSGSKGNPQTLYLGTPTRAGSTAEVFQDVRAEAWSDDPPPDLCWTEYGVDEVGDIYDESRWPTVNPSLGLIANYTAIRLGLPPNLDELAFAQEYLGYWLPKVADAVISPKEWEELAIDAEDAPREGGITAYGVKFSPDGSTVAVCAAYRATDLPVHIELVFNQGTSKGTAWLAEWIAARPGKAACAVIDGLAGADALEVAVGKMPANYIVRPGAAAVVSSASMMLEAVRGGGVTHLDDPALNLAATTATKRKIGSRGGWGWDGDNATPMEAASLALWGVMTTKRRPGRKLRIG